MREIKFRAWDKVAKAMSPSFVLFGEFTLMGLIHDWQASVGEKMNIGDSLFRLKDLEIMQFTGLLDKNGKEIFEGDIVDSGKGEIFYCNKSAMFKVRWHDKVFKNVRGNSQNYNNGERLFMNSHIAWEVIGNIYENPDLLPPNPKAVN